MADGGLPLRIVIGVGGDVQRYALFIQGGPGQGHIALPADEAAHGAPGGLRHREVGPVGVAPDHPLCSGGLELAVAGGQPSVGREEQIGVIQRGGDGVPLTDADADPGTGLPGGPAQQLRLRAGDQNGVVVVTFPVLAAALVPMSHGKAKGHAEGITGNEQLREHDQLRLEPGGLQNQGDGLFYAGILSEQNGGCLYYGHPAGGLEVLHSGCSFPGESPTQCGYLHAQQPPGGHHVALFHLPQALDGFSLCLRV